MCSHFCGHYLHSSSMKLSFKGKDVFKVKHWELEVLTLSTMINSFLINQEFLLFFTSQKLLHCQK